MAYPETQQSHELPSTTPALVFYGEGDLRFVPSYELELAPEEDKRYTTLGVLRAGICGSDLLILRGDHPHGDPPFVLGHEGVYRDPEGQIVVARTTFASCLIRDGKLTHPSCKKHRDDFLCPDKTVYGIGGPDGVFAQTVVVPAASIIEVPKDRFQGLDEETTLYRLVQAEPAAVAATALARARLEPGQAVFIDGVTGNLGAMAALEAKQQGASWVGGSCTERGFKNGRAEILQELGIDKVYLREDSKDFNPPGLVSIYIDATPVGAPSFKDPEFCQRLEKDATVVLAGVYPAGRQLPIDMQTIVFRGINIIGAISSTRSAWEWVVGDFLPEVPVDRLVTGVYPLAEFAEAFQVAQNTGGKVLFNPSAQ